MVIKNLSTRPITLRDEDGNQYIVPSLGETVLDDDLIEDTTFRRWLRWRLRDVFISPFVNISKNDDPIDSKPTINFIEGENITLTLTPQSNQLDVEIAAGANIDYNSLLNIPTSFPTTINSEDVAVAVRSSLNFHAGTNIQLTVEDDDTNDEVDITITSLADTTADWADITGKPATFAPSAHKTSHEVGGTDILTGSLNANARVAVWDDGTLVGTRRKLNFIEGNAIAITLNDDNSNERVDVTIASTAPAAAPTDATYITLTSNADLSAESVLGDSIIMTGANIDHPAVGIEGRLYYVTNVGGRRLTRDSGTQWEDFVVDWNYIGSKPTTFAPSAHATSHQSGGTDPIKLDELAAPDDTTDLNVTSATHGLVPKLPADSAKFLSGVGTWIRPAPATHAGTHKSGGSDPIKLDEFAAPTDVTTLNVSTTAHGLTPKLSNNAGQFLNGTGGWTVPATQAHAASHTSGQSDALTGTLDATARAIIAKAGVTTGTRRKLNFIEGSGISLTLADDSAGEKVDVTVALSNTSVAPSTASYITLSAESGLTSESVLGTSIVMKGLASAQPVTGSAGRLYYITDAGVERLTRDTGTAWDDMLIGWNYVSGKPSTFTPATHQTAHQSGGTDALTGSVDANARVGVGKNGAAVTGTRRKINLVEGTNVTMTVVDDSVNERVNVTVNADLVGVASVDATYITAAPEGGLTQEKVLGTDVIGKGLNSAKPAAGLAGAIWFTTDAAGQRIQRDTGIIWEDFLYHWNYITGKPTTFTPATHATTHQPGGSDAMAVDAAAGVGSLRTLGTSATSATAGNDSRLSDARTPTAHQASHRTGGTDALGGNIDANARTAVAKNSGITVGTRRQLNLIEGSNVVLTIADDNNNERVNVTVAITSFPWASLTGVPATFAPSAHATSHQPGGADAMAVDAAAGVGSLRTLGTGATQATAGNDARLSDNRTPLDNSVTSAKIADGTILHGDIAAANKDGLAGTPSMRTLGTGAQQAAAGNDSRLSNARTPTAHATTHKTGGTDAIKLDELAAPTDVTTLNVSTTAHGLAPKLPNDATKYLDGTGVYSVPTVTGGGGGSASIPTFYVDTTPIQATNNTQTSMLADYLLFPSSQIPTGTGIFFYMSGEFLNNTGASKTFSLKLDFTTTVGTAASTTLWQVTSGSIASSTLSRAWSMSGLMVIEDALGVPGRIQTSGVFTMSSAAAAPTVGIGDLSTAAIMAPWKSPLVLNSTLLAGDPVLRLYVTLSSTTANFTMGLYEGFAYLV